MPQVPYQILGAVNPAIEPGSFGSLGRMEQVSQAIVADRNAQRQAQADQMMRQIVSQHPDDPGQAISALRRAGFAKEAIEAEKAWTENRTKLAQLRKSELDAEWQAMTNRGETPAQKLAAEKQFLDNAKPETLAQWIAVIDDDPASLQNAIGAATHFLGERAKPLIDAIPKDPAAARAWAQQLLIGPAKQAELEATKARDAATAANTLRDDERAAAAAAETARHNKATETTAAGHLTVAQQAAARAAAGAAGTGTLSLADKKLVESVMRQPTLFKTLVPSVQTRIASELESRGFKFETPQDNKPPTGVERRVGGFFNRAKQADEDLQNTEEGIAQSGLTAQLWREWMPNFLQTTEGQQYTAAQRAFTEARLRKDSGAAIPEQEFKNDRQTYFVQAGDSAETVKQKQRARAAILASLARESGRALREHYGDEADSLIAGYVDRSKQPDKNRLTKEIPGFPGSVAESTDGGKTWKRIK